MNLFFHWARKNALRDNDGRRLRRRRPAERRSSTKGRRLKLEFLEFREYLAVQSVVINFDNLPRGTVVTNQYPEATFSSDSTDVNKTDSEFNLGSSGPNYILTANAVTGRSMAFIRRISTSREPSTI